MKRLKRGPELKVPELKVPQFVSDLYWDLRDRRLLPLIALAVVALVAVPFLLGGGSESPPAKPSGIATSNGGREAAEAASLTVVQARPGLRDYRKRLDGRRPTDPFVQRYTAPSLNGAELGSSASSSDSVSSVSSTATTTTTESGSGSTAGTVTVESNGGSSDAPSQGQSQENSQPDGEPTSVAHAIDVRISRTAGEGTSWIQELEPTVKHNVAPQSPLPGNNAPVVTYMGLSKKAAGENTTKALLLVSDRVSSISGKVTCASDKTDGGLCQMLEVAPDSPVVLAYGVNDLRYTIKILKIDQ